MKLLLFLALTTLLPAAPKPNIVLIMADDMGFSDLGCYGSEIETPNLDRLAANGLRFSQFYNTGRCCPTRASLLTGLHPHQTGIGHMTEDYGLPAYRGTLSQETPTIAEVLGKAGYRNYMSGKWHLTRTWQEDGDKKTWPMRRGFHDFYGTIIGAGSFYDPAALCRRETFITPENDPDYQPERYHYTDAITNNAVSFLKTHKKDHLDTPFFLYTAYTSPHWPLHAFPEDIARYKGKYDAGYAPIREARLQKLQKLGLLKNVTEPAPLIGDWSEIENKAWESRCMETYAAMITQMDRGIGNILAEIESQGQIENTLVLFLQDNGGCAEPFGRIEHPRFKQDETYQPLGKNGLQTRITPPMQTRDGRPVQLGPDTMPGPENTFIAYGQNWANVSNTPFRLYKHYVHEGGIATPLIASWPAGLAPHAVGTWNDSPAHLIDIMATATDLAQTHAPLQEGVSLRKAFLGHDLDREEPLFWEHEGNRAVRHGKWKIVAQGNDGLWELYDMETDRAETHDLAVRHPEIVEPLATAYKNWAARVGAVPFGSWKK